MSLIYNGLERWTAAIWSYDLHFISFYFTKLVPSACRSVEPSRMKGNDETRCFECLQTEIRQDFSDKLIFRYGVSDSPLPFGNAAVVQVHLPPSLHPPLIAISFVVWNVKPCFFLNLQVNLRGSSENQPIRRVIWFLLLDGFSLILLQVY